MPDLSPLPKMVKVGPYLYRIHKGGKDWDTAKLIEQDDELLGHCDHRSLTISLHPDLAVMAEREVVLHELLHACLNAVGQPLQDMNRDSAEENAVSVLAPMLLSALRDNEQLVDYLLAA